MEDDLFGGVNIEDLANAEGAIVDAGDLTPVPEIEKPVEKSTEEIKAAAAAIEAEEAPIIDDGGIDLDELAGHDPNLETDEEGSNGSTDNKTQTPADKGNTLSSQTVPYASLASALHEAGVLSFTEDEDIEKVVDADTLMTVIADQIKSNEYSDLDDNQKEYLEAMRDGVPHQDYAQAKSNANQYNNITDEAIGDNEALQKELVRRSFVIRGFSDDKANQYAETLSSPEEAVNARNALVAHEEKQVQDKLAEAKASTASKLKQEADQLSALQSKINETSEIIPGIKVNAQTKGKIFGSMTSPTDASEAGDLLNEVMTQYKEDDDYKVRLHALHVVTKGFTDFSKISKTSKTKAIKDLDSSLRSSNGIGGSGRPMATHGVVGKTSKDIALSIPDFKSKKYK